MNFVARIRHVLARRPWLYWLAVPVLAASAGLVVADATAGVDAARRSWGTTRPVVVAAVDVAPGQLLTDHVEVRTRPEPMVPAGAVSDLPSTATARQRIAAGEIVMAHDVAAIAGPRALIPDGWRGRSRRRARPVRRGRRRRGDGGERRGRPRRGRRGRRATRRGSAGGRARGRRGPGRARRGHR